MLLSTARIKLYDKLYDYQKNGVEWILKSLERSTGAILADEMGLGKTIQTIACIEILHKNDPCTKILVIVPASLLQNWEKEFKKWQMECPFNVFYGKDKLESLRRLFNRNGVLLTTYNTVLVSFNNLCGITFDFLIVDEGHVLRNESKTTKIVKSLSANKRLVLTGTPLQNNLMELWSVFDFIMNGNSQLGTKRNFRSVYVKKIHKANEKDSSQRMLEMGNKLLKSLKELVDPFILRRTIDEINMQHNLNNIPGKREDYTSTDGKFTEIPPKLDIVCWTYLSKQQISLYELLVASKELDTLMKQNKSPLIAIQNLKKLCDHPTRLPVLRVGALLDEFKGEEALELLSRQQSNANLSTGELIEASGKLKFAIRLLNSLQSEGHRTLVFSRSLLVLDVIEKILLSQGHSLLRLDGQITSHERRSQIVESFQGRMSRVSFLLLTTMVGGVGLTLTAADRVVIYDPSWNPANDSQAVGRAHRVGQTRPVVIYRLISCGTVEEKIYRRQIFKDTINRGVMTKASDNPFNRHFTFMELRHLISFDLSDFRESKTQIQLSDTASDIPPLFEDCLRHFHGFNDCFGISNHDLVFDVTAETNEEDEMDYEDPTDCGDDLIRHCHQSADVIDLTSSPVKVILGHTLMDYKIESTKSISPSLAETELCYETKTFRSLFESDLIRHCHQSADVIDLTSSPVKVIPGLTLMDYKNESTKSISPSLAETELCNETKTFRSLFESGSDADNTGVVLASASSDYLQVSDSIPLGDDSSLFAGDSLEKEDGHDFSSVISDLLAKEEYIDAMDMTLNELDLSPNDPDLQRLALNLRYILWPDS